jgi:hypothetical protein
MKDLWNRYKLVFVGRTGCLAIFNCRFAIDNFQFLIALFRVFFAKNTAFFSFFSLYSQRNSQLSITDRYYINVKHHV